MSTDDDDTFHGGVGGDVAEEVQPSSPASQNEGGAPDATGESHALTLLWYFVWHSASHWQCASKFFCCVGCAGVVQARDMTRVNAERLRLLAAPLSCGLVLALSFPHRGGR